MKTKIFFYCTISIVLLTIFSTSLFAQWVQVNNGLTNGDVRSLTVLGNNIFAGTNGSGVFLSTDNGNNWTQSGLTNLQVDALAVSGNNIFAGTNGNGVFLSTDNGNSWTTINNGLSNLSIMSIYVSGSYIYAGTFGGGVFRTANNGSNWTQVNNGLSTLNINAFAFDGQYLYAGGTGLFRTSNNGSIWSSINTFNNIWVHSIAVMGTSIFVATESHGIYRSTDNGNSWTQINNGLTNLIVQSLYVVGTSIFAGTNSGVYLSTNYGDNWNSTGLSKIAFSFAKLGTYIFAGTGFTDGVFRRTLSEMMSVVNVTITSDNAYVYGFGDINGIIDYHYPGVANLLAHEIYSHNTGTETYTIAGNLTGKYIYIVAWSDEAVYQGTIAQFSNGNTTILTSPTLPNPFVNWEVFATGIDLDPQTNDPEPTSPNYIPRRNSNCPSLIDVNQQISIANLNQGNPNTTSVGWVSTTPILGRIGVLAFGHNNSTNYGGFPPQTVSGIDVNAQWMWYNPDPNNITQPFVTGGFPDFPADKSREYYIFRVGPLDSIFTTCQCINPPSNMVGWWTMDETLSPANDLAGVNNTGTWVNNPTPVAGKVDGALSFYDNYLDVSNQPELDLGRGDFSIDAWILSGNCKEGTISPIVDKLDSSSTPQRGFSFYLTQNPVGSMFLNININGTTYTSTTSFQINTNQWVHVAASVQRGTTPSTGTFYINGQQVGTFTPNLDGPVTNNVNLWIGKSRLTNNICFIDIDELELFNRAITQSEIQSIWAADTCGKCKPSNLFGEICITKFNDLNGSGKQDQNEGPVYGFTFDVTDANNNLIGSVLFDQTHKPCINVPAPGTYTVTEVPQSGWITTTPNPQTVTVSPGQTYNLTFGNRRDTCVTPPKGMLNWWPLDETTGSTSFDIASFNNNGTWINNPTPTPGMVSGALKFDGKNYVSVPNHAELNFGSSDFSIDMWIWTNAVNGRRTILDKREKWDNNLLGYELFILNGYLALQLADGSSTDYVSTGFVADSQWHHIAVTVKRTNSTGLMFYVDGVVVSTFDPTNHSGNLDNKAPLLIGKNHFDPDYNFIGIIDEVEMFRFVLPSQDILNIYNAGSKGKCKEPITGIKEEINVPSDFKLLQCYPNPFNPSTTIEYHLPTSEFVKLSVFNALGEEIAILVNEFNQAGIHKIIFDSRNLASGIYFYQLRAGNFQETRKFILLK